MNIHYPPDAILSGKQWKRIKEHITESSVEEYVQKVVSLRGSRRIAIVGRSGVMTRSEHQSYSLQYQLASG